MSILQETVDNILTEGGFIYNGKKSTGLIDAETASRSINTDLRYTHLFTEESETESIDLIYEVPSQVEDIPGTPSIYFKFLDHHPTADTITKLRTSIWNQGRIPTLWIVTPASILVYDSFARPQYDETEQSHLLTKLTRVGTNLKRLRDIEALHKQSFDSGNFWQSTYGQKIKRSQSVDLSMLADLSKTVEILTSSNPLSHTPPLSASIAHVLLGRAIFVSYLQDRSILSESFFKKNYGYNSLKDMLEDTKVTYSFFRWLRDTFNGNLFPLVLDEEKIVHHSHLKVIQHFLSGADMRSYPLVQTRLWPYRFDIIPIELISSIYEMFAHNLDPEAAEARSVHYTRFQLVEMILSLAMRGVEATAQVLDPACGSGVFLVEAFRRLVWLHSRKKGRFVRRDELHDILRSQIFGIDLNSDAVNVTAFSLYLALLELDPDPQPLEALKFPNLLRDPSSKDEVPNLYIQDFCNTGHEFNKTKPFHDKGFDIIIGNPPWTALKKDMAPYDPDDPQSGRQWSLEYCLKHQIPDKKPDQAFILRARDFARSDTKILFIVCSRIFYQQEDRSWLETFLENNTFKTVINLSDLVGEKVLFGGMSSTRLPASIIEFYPALPMANNKIMYITPKWYPGISKQDEIIITSDDIRTLSQRLLKQKPFLWKSGFRGIPRDYRLLSRLQNLRSLESTLSEAGVKKLAHRGIIFGKGEQVDASILWGKLFLPSGLANRYDINITSLSLFERSTIAKRRKPRFLELPSLIISRSLRNGKPCIALVEPTDSRRDLVIDQMYYGIPFSEKHPDLVYRLNAIFNSKMAFYMAFMFSSGLGWDRRLIEVGDWLQVRLPETILDEGDDLLWTHLLTLERWLRNNWQSETSPALTKEIDEVEAQLDQLVFKLYDMSEQEIILVEDTLRYNISAFISRKQRALIPEAFSKPTIHDLENYAKRMILQIDGILHFNNLRLTAKVFDFKNVSSLFICQFTQEAWKEELSINRVHLPGIEEALSALAPLLRTEIADHLSIQRNLHIYDEDSLWIIKPSEKRFWSEAAALSDADTVISEHMEVPTHG